MSILFVTYVTRLTRILSVRAGLSVRSGVQSYLLVILALLFIITGCSPAAVEPTDDALTEEPLTEEPTVEVTEQATATIPPTPDATDAPTPTPTPQPTLEPGIIPTLDEFLYAQAEGCPFLPPGVGEDLIGTLTQPAWMGQAYSDYAPRFMVTCYYLGELNSLFLKLWIADTEAEARDAFARWDEYSVPVEGLGDEAVWWPRLLRLEVRHHNALLWITFDRPIDNAANTAAQFASLSLPLIDPALGNITPPQITIPADAPTPEYVRDLAQEPEFFDACGLASEEEFEAITGPLSEVPQGGGSIGEMVGYFYDCNVSNETGFLFYSIHVGSPTSVLEMFANNERFIDPSAIMLPMEIGDHARLLQPNEYQAEVVRGNVSLSFIISLESSPENEQRVRDFIALIVDRLFERYGE